MAGDKDASTTTSHRLSRLTAKLLRRPSTSPPKRLLLAGTPSTPSTPAAAPPDAVPRPPDSPRPRLLGLSVPSSTSLSSQKLSPTSAKPADATPRLAADHQLRGSWCSLETATDTTAQDKSNDKLLGQTVKAKDALELLDRPPDCSSAGPGSAVQAPPAPQPCPSNTHFADEPPPPTASEAPRRGDSLRRTEEPGSGASLKEASLPSSRSLSVRRSDSRSAASRALNVVDESSQIATLPSPLATAPPKLVPASAIPATRPPLAIRRQSLVPASQQRLIKTLLEPGPPGSGGDYFSRGTPTIQADMISRKIWVKRAGSSPTLVCVTEEDLVDDLREAILRKYANSLGRTFDAPDVVLKLVPREPSSRQSNSERFLGPEEPVGRTLDHYYPGGQAVGEALIIETPQRRTPRPSPRHNVSYSHQEDIRPGEADEYFPPMHVIQTPNVPSSISSGSIPSSHQHSMAVITTGQLPAVPSPGSRGSWHNIQHRPKFPRQHTSSPTIIGATPAVNNLTDTVDPPVNGVPSMPSPQATTTPPIPVTEVPPKSVHTPPARVSSPRPAVKFRALKKNSSGTTADSSPSSARLLDGTIPPINVLIVEDNTINLKLLEAFMKRLKVRWQTAMNGREAVNKWRGGGFHLVLMDIQLPVMNGLEATREIRRLERVNDIGVFSKGVSGSAHAMIDDAASPPSPEDFLDKTSLVKSPVIIVALTASSLQSDRDEALAAGCNDFLTKPVNMIWLEKKVTEWGCMQALIDFEGWRKWRGFDSATSIPVPQHLQASITNTALTSSPGTKIPTLRSSQLSVVAGCAAQGEKLATNKREASPAPKSPVAGVYPKTGGKDSVTSSTSTIVPNGGGGASGALAPLSKPPASNSNNSNTSNNGSIPLSPSTTTPSGKRASRVPTPAKTSPA
ncbi:Two-component response regulator SSK1p [Ophidiomyces ophidiicola]|nr:Two-component response regulator SSK1p [Ophidiomyces ophidiicola]KAI1995377.1 Two-component response regulator SSK1p [Ophidiomyces ophidiicola]KAI2000639.1 Two-component response regulator SSK1p [Ophidiomyces ophidiicola]KAI2008209.1 Two-component response regulator SSK1p [Ophidiomyces ophidiicola]KAI2023214.1 Two-component response regulator SSK1p [Ophidiomyces ophidiicola]